MGGGSYTLFRNLPTNESKSHAGKPLLRNLFFRVSLSMCNSLYDEAMLKSLKTKHDIRFLLFLSGINEGQFGTKSYMPFFYTL